MLGYVLQYRDDRGLEFTAGQSVEEGEMCIQFIDASGEVLRPEPGHAVVMWLVCQKSDDVDCIVLGYAVRSMARWRGGPGSRRCLSPRRSHTVCHRSRG